MSTAQPAPTPGDTRRYHVIDLNYVSLYVNDFEAAIAFYTRLFGQPESVNSNETTYGWRMGSTWLTVFTGKAGPQPNNNPRNTEFAIQVAEPGEVDLLYQALVEAGARSFMAPEDTTMYEPMRFCCVDDPFGVRIDVYCPLAGHQP
jgi:uncharacterized glyoxalase superfamily protein PhnB